MISRRLGIIAIVLLAPLVAAPTVGDVGSCGTAAEPLGAPEFFSARLAMVCRRCHDCDYGGRTCTLVCDQLAKKSFPRAFPEGCHPVVHDGEVCLRAIDALSCNDFGDLVSDAPIVPTECDFCPASAAETK
jgi:hypothetical protein